MKRACTVISHNVSSVLVFIKNLRLV